MLYSPHAVVYRICYIILRKEWKDLSNKRKPVKKWNMKLRKMTCQNMKH